MTCAYCSVVFSKTTRSLARSKSGLYFCCMTHKVLAQRIGGIKAIQPSHYGTGDSGYREIAFAAFPHKCNRCPYDKVQAVLHVHHKDRDRKNCSLDNLEILCANCHAEEHYLASDGQFWMVGRTDHV